MLASSNLSSVLQPLVVLAQCLVCFLPFRKRKSFSAGFLGIGQAPIFAAMLFLASAPVAAGEAGKVLALRAYVGQLRTVDVLINGKNARMLFDSGGGITSVTPEFAATIGCRPSGQIVGFRMDGQRAEFRRCGYATMTFGRIQGRLDLAVFDLGKVLPAGLPHVDGIVGFDAFRGKRVTLLSGLRGIKIERSSSVGPRGGKEGHMRLANESGGAGLSVFVAAKAVDLDLWLLLDSANLAGIRLHPKAYELLDPGQPSAQPRKLPLGLTGAGWVERTPLVIPDLIYDGALDAEFISGFDVTIDLGTQRIWWAKAAK